MPADQTDGLTAIGLRIFGDLGIDPPIKVLRQAINEDGSANGEPRVISEMQPGHDNTFGLGARSCLILVQNPDGLAAAGDVMALLSRLDVIGAGTAEHEPLQPGTAPISCALEAAYEAIKGSRITMGDMTSAAIRPVNVCWGIEAAPRRSPYQAIPPEPPAARLGRWLRKTLRRIRWSQT
jgi:hypothetical protein